MPIIGSLGAPLRTNPPPMEYQTCSSTVFAAASNAWNRMLIGVRGHALPLFEHHVTVVVEMDAFEAGEVQSTSNAQISRMCIMWSVSTVAGR